MSTGLTPAQINVIKDFLSVSITQQENHLEECVNNDWKDQITKTRQTIAALKALYTKIK